MGAACLNMGQSNLLSLVVLLFLLKYLRCPSLITSMSTFALHISCKCKALLSDGIREPLDRFSCDLKHTGRIEQPTAATHVVIQMSHTTVFLLSQKML